MKVSCPHHVFWLIRRFEEVILKAALCGECKKVPGTEVPLAAERAALKLEIKSKKYLGGQLVSNPIHSDMNNPTTLAQYCSEVEAAAILAALSESGIQGTTTGSFTTGFQAEAPGDVTVVVRQSDLPRALEVLAELETVKKDIDWGSVDVGEPEA